MNATPLCWSHYADRRRADAAAGAREAAKPRLESRPPADTISLDRLRETTPVPPVRIYQAEAVVYYVGDPDSQLVKIGTSTRLKSRLRTIRQYRPRAILLATEPGTYPTEYRRHYQFRVLREPLPTGETEWFRKVPLLMEHIGRIRIEYGILSPGARPVYGSWIAPLQH